jgi:prevent-host-death family protein
MRVAGVRELRQRASEYLRAVAAGDSVQITDRGRPVALLTPIPAGSALDRLRAEGRVRPAAGDPWELGPPLPPRPGQPPPSDALAAARADER